MREVIIDNADGRLVVDILDQGVVFHVKAIRFTKEAFAYYRRVFESMLVKLAGMGYRRVYATPFANDPWAMSITRSFGFRERRRKDGVVLMAREI